jgi:hypothetical protein
VERKRSEQVRPVNDNPAWVIELMKNYWEDKETK